MTLKTKKWALGIVLLLGCSALGLKCQDEKQEIKPPPTAEPADVVYYLTRADKSVLFAQQESGVNYATENSYPTIEVDKSTKYQEIDGFGFSLTGGSALHLSNMSSAKRKELLTELFATSSDNIGISYLRVSLGASDLDEKVFSYDDLSAGETDVDMNNFSLNEDKKYLLPVLKEILEIAPAIKIMASPWSAPVWMKDNNSSIGGSLKTEYYDAYAKYFVKYVQGMKAEGINIEAITVQNEPLHAGNNPSMYMTAVQQANFVKNNLGPAFEQAGIETKIIVYDHNADRTDYPIEIMNDNDAKKYIDGSAFHLYGGNINDLNLVHIAHPDKNLYFTEQWLGAPGSFPDDLKWHTANLIIGATRNWCKTVLEWNLTSNSNLEPHTDGGCTQCLGGLTIDGDVVTRNPGYYIIAHASKLIRPGSVRIKTNLPEDLPNVAFETPEGSVVIIVLNNADTEKYFNFEIDNKTVTCSLSGGAVGTFKF